MSSPPVLATFRVTFAVASLAWFAFALDKLVVATALPRIRTDLGASPTALEWAVNSFTLTFAVLLMTGSALGDRFGRRRVFAIGMTMFTVASALAGFAPNMATLVAARALQGAGGALFAPVSLTLLSLATSAERRGAVFGLWGGVGAVGAAIGPVVGGLLTQTLGWRSAFWVNVPLGLVLVPLACRGLDESRGPDGALDVPGVASATVGLVGVVWGVMRGGERGWLAPDVWVSIGLGVLALMAFLAWERRAVRPILPTGLFRNRAFAIASASSLTMYAALFGTFFFIAQLFQTGLGEPPLAAGLHTMPVAVLPVLLSPVGGHLADRFGVRPLLIGGLLTLAVALGWFGLVAAPGVSYLLLLPGLLLMGAGAALFFGPITAATQGAVGEHEQGQASGVGTTVREVAAVLGVAVVGAVFTAHGGFSSPALFFAGLHAAVLAGAIIAIVGVLVTRSLPRRNAPSVDLAVELAGDRLTPDKERTPARPR